VLAVELWLSLGGRRTPAPELSETVHDDSQLGARRSFVCLAIWCHRSIPPTLFAGVRARARGIGAQARLS
jgi:hypothetical protein